MKKLKVIFMFLAAASLLVPSSMNAGATCAPCGESGIVITCPDADGGSACGYWFPADNVAAVICHPRGNLVMVDCEGIGDSLEDSL